MFQSTHNSTRMPSFKEAFKTNLYTDKVGHSRSLRFFVDDGKYVNSLRIIAERVEDTGENQENHEVFKLFDICWQEEYLLGSLHNVCRSKDEDFAIYDYTNDKFIQDIYLYDKYNDCSDGWFSAHPISNLFVQIPKAEFAKRDMESLTDTSGFHSSSTEWRDWSEYDPEEMKKIDEIIYKK